MNTWSWGIEAVERGLVPDALTRLAIRRLCRARLNETGAAATDVRRQDADFHASLRQGPIAPLPEKANEQHYELPPEFFAAVLGPRRKYSCCYFADRDTSLAEAEEAALAITCERARLADGQEILELGCGWGSLTLWMAERYPYARIMAVSNSRPQRGWIVGEAAARGLKNVRVITADMNDFEADAGRFDRVVSVEMFEHMRNYDRLLANIARWLRSDGKLFVHLFCHRDRCYPFETAGADNWMGRHFFSGGIMPSADLLRQFNRDLTVVRHQVWNGDHYRRTAEAWLARLDAARDDVLQILRQDATSAEARRRFQRWRVFFLAVAELFGYDGGEQWFVSHYLLERST
jgi:cyclopropane-fatty-acyl-phospholipid synthase